MPSTVADDVSVPLREQVARLEQDVQRLARAADEARGWSEVDRRAALAAVDKAIGVLSAVRGSVLVAVRQREEWRGSGDPTFEAWRARTSRAGAGVARRQVRQAEAATHLPAMRAAVLDGSVTPAHLDALATVVRAVPPAVQEALASPATQAELVGAARRLDARAFATTAARVAARLDPGTLERSHQAQRAARFLHLSDGPDGTRLSGQVDRMAGHRLRLALEAVTPRPAADDERTSEQRRADALDSLAEKVLSAPETTSGAAVRPHVSFQMTAETWAGLKSLSAARAEAAAVEVGRARAGAGHAGRADVGTVDAGRADVGLGGLGGTVPSIEPVTLDDGTPVPLSEVARALCDCELTRVVTDAEGAVLDLGRTQRTYTGAQRRAVVTRDRGCGWNGCAAQARWCEVHHIRWWDRDGGETSVENGILLCSFHHHEVHRRELAIERVARPPGDVAGRVEYVFRDPLRRVVSSPEVESPPGVESPRKSVPSAVGARSSGVVPPRRVVPSPEVVPSPGMRSSPGAVRSSGVVRSSPDVDQPRLELGDAGRARGRARGQAALAPA